MPLRLSDIGKEVIQTHYAVRGPIVARAKELQKEGKNIIFCNIGNPQALGQKPLTYVRQVLSLVQCPELIDKGKELFPDDILSTAKTILKESEHGLGAYSDSKGLFFVRRAVSSFIEKRDSTAKSPVSSDPESIYLTDGASKAVQSILRLLISDEHDGIMIPIPQYPLYSATISLYGGTQVGYYLDEANGWNLSRRMLDQAYASAVKAGTRVKAICVINPGNPTGTVLTEENIAMVIGFAREHGISILADEVYQENLYRSEDKFVSFAKVISRLDEKDVSLFSFHSCSKGYLGECGQRGGYVEVRNLPADVMAELTKLQSVSLCANLSGQILVYLMVSPPQSGTSSYGLFIQERDTVLGELALRARILAEGLNRIPGFSCQPITGAMYAFPTLTLPKGRTDEEYCMALLESTGVCVVPGTGFGQKPGSSHFRTTILPPTKQVEEVVQKIAEFHSTWK
jgi:aspartate/methionine/tyrosine aminotransferase